MRGFKLKKKSVIKEKYSKGPIIAKGNQFSAPNPQKAFKLMSKSHWGLAAMKLVLS